MEMSHRKAQLALAKRSLLDTAKLIRLQEELVVLLRAKGSDAEVSTNLLSTFRTTASILADHANTLERQIETEAMARELGQKPPRPSYFTWLRKYWA